MPKDSFNKRKFDGKKWMIVTYYSHSKKIHN
jgi:hypothetical protein